mmetsp:Transcript_9687/g.23848  ORF Transcript_9687/g.23848 Transcript_9687/m.23848 type:complete len:168 (+) Transcript_9687:90-593(+)|eukprot:CAMPEP_0178998914 /NCGR_PEP_ID=MMETSP0795-20121207/9764_1 /TAXON_ID=88552 /ORGANISM="Amoebophrya sp., Strain Ameob2" /LENGTH=167 /DNA_ID=CAMNT_0020691619 /DNA_START=32 /DNA_END=535 /DNA_ORIENTATION=-
MTVHLSAAFSSFATGHEDFTQATKKSSSSWADPTAAFPPTTTTSTPARHTTPRVRSRFHPRPTAFNDEEDDDPNQNFNPAGLPTTGDTPIPSLAPGEDLDSATDPYNGPAMQEVHGHTAPSLEGMNEAGLALLVAGTARALSAPGAGASSDDRGKGFTCRKAADRFL